MLDAEPIQCLRVPGPSFVPMIAALFLGASFITATFHWWWAMFGTLFLALAAVIHWLWRATSVIPEKTHKDVGRGLSLPLYVSGPHSVSWWAMFITMLGDMTAFLSLVFGYLFYFTIHEAFPPAEMSGPGVAWPATALLLFALAFGATLLSHLRMRAGAVGQARGLIALGTLAVLAGGAALLMGPHATGLAPRAHVYPAIVWLLAIWTALHAVVGAIMLLYCLARSLAGQLTPRHDIDLANVRLYFHFLGATALITVAVLVLVPLASGGNG